MSSAALSTVSGSVPPRYPARYGTSEAMDRHQPEVIWFILIHLGNRAGAEAEVNAQRQGMNLDVCSRCQINKQ
jgi:hypothetical protein